VTEPAYFIKASLEEYATWKVCFEERLELVSEVRALDVENAGLKNDLAVLERGYRYRKSQLDVALANSEYLRGQVDKSSGEILRLRAELSGEIARRCLGGTPPPSNAPHWQNEAAPPVPSSVDNSAPPLHRSDTSSSAHRARVGEAVDHVHAVHGDVLKRLGDSRG
jgi:hypothetical protein